MIAAESFDYTPGTNLEGQTGGSGWGGGWTADADGTFTATAPGLAYPGVTSAGNAAEILPGAATATYYRDLGATLTNGDTFYVGFIAQKTIVDDATRYFGVGLFQNSSERTLIGQASGSTNWTVNGVGAQYGLPTNVLGSATSSQQQSYLLARIDLRAGVETVTFWVNPDLSKGELENTPVGGRSFVTNADFGSVNRLRVGGGGANDTQAASAHLLDELLVSTTSPFASGNVRLFYDNGEDTTAGSTALPLFGAYSPKPFAQLVLEAGSGATTPGGNVAPATAVGEGKNVMAIDRDNSQSTGRRNYGQFVTPAVTEGTVRVEVDIFVVDGQIQFGLGSSQSGNALDGAKLTLGLNLSGSGAINAYSSNTLISGVTFDVGQWEHFIVEYELGSGVYSFTVNGVTTEVALPLGVPVTEMNHVWLAAGTGSTTGFYDNLDVRLIVPEPASALLAGASVIALVSRRRSS